MHNSLAFSPELLALLQHEGLISPERAAFLSRRSVESWMPLGGVLRKQEKLSMGQLMQLLQLQAVHPGEPLGEIAIREGFCTRRDVEAALRFQRESTPHPLEFLLSEPDCNHAKLCRALATYIRRLETRLEESSIAASTGEA